MELGRRDGRTNGPGPQSLEALPDSDVLGLPPSPGVSLWLMSYHLESHRKVSLPHQEYHLLEWSHRITQKDQQIQAALSRFISSRRHFSINPTSYQSFP